MSTHAISIGATTVKIIADPAGKQAADPNLRHLLSPTSDGGSPQMTQIATGPSGAPQPSTTQSAEPPAAQNVVHHAPPQYEHPSPGTTVRHHVSQAPLMGDGSFEVQSGSHGTRVVIHRPLVATEIAPGVHQHEGYKAAPGEMNVIGDTPVLQTSHKKHKARTSTKKKAGRVNRKKKTRPDRPQLKAGSAPKDKGSK